MAKSVQFPYNKRLATTKGHVFLFEACKPREVPDSIYREAMRQGGVDGKVKMSVEDSGDESSEDERPAFEGPSDDDPKPPVEAIAEVVRDIIDGGNSDHIIESSGKVKVNVLKEYMRRDDITAEDRDAAHELLEQGDA